MSRFEQLQATYATAAEVRLAYWSDLYRMVSRIKNDFCVYLGVSFDAQIPVGQRSLPVVSIGSMSDRNEYADWALEKLPREGELINFALRLAYGNNSSPDIAPIRVFELKLMKADDAYYVKIKGLDDTFKGPVFDVLFEELFRMTKSNISAR